MTIVLTPYMKLQGIFAAITTPFDYKGDIYPAKVQHNVEKWNRTALAGYVVCSSAGEGVLLSPEEKISVWKMVAQHAGLDRILIADAGVEGVRETVALANHAAGLGYKAVLCGVPHHYKTMMYGTDAQMLYYRAVADRSEVPVIIHNAPHYTGVDVSSETIAQLSEHPNIAGVIESGTPASRLRQTSEAARNGFQLLTGSAGGIWEALQAGAHGAAISFACAAPYAAIAIWEAFRTREHDAGLDWQARIAHPSVLVTDLYGVPGLKYAMDLNGYYGGPPRLPLVALPNEARAEIEEAFRDLKG
ncbi:MAG: dihydrodipicolinate synthase family protein [Acidobacteriota bacterium]|nr:dihydrodipicolinate synthase family protein [Acidobacteriota bacterium]